MTPEGGAGHSIRLGVFNKIFADPADKRGKLERSMIDTTHLRRTA